MFLLTNRYRWRHRSSRYLLFFFLVLLKCMILFCIFFYKYTGIMYVCKYVRTFIIWTAKWKGSLEAFAHSAGPDQTARIPRSRSGSSLSANIIIGYCKMYYWRANARMILCACAGLSESSHARRHCFAWSGPYKILQVSIYHCYISVSDDSVFLICIPTADVKF